MKTHVSFTQVLSRARSRCAVGFSLIELLTVIAVISILSAVIIPAISTARRSAVEVKASGEMRGIAQSLLVYAQDNSQCLPGTFPGWDKDLCRMLAGTGADGEPIYNDILHNSQDDIARNASQPRSYSYNPTLCNYQGKYATGGQKINSGIPLTSITQPSELTMLVTKFNELNIYGGAGWMVCDTFANFTLNDKAVVAFCDGSVRSYAASDYGTTNDIREYRADHIAVAP